MVKVRVIGTVWKWQIENARDIYHDNGRLCAATGPDSEWPILWRTQHPLSVKAPAHTAHWLVMPCIWRETWNQSGITLCDYKILLLRCCSESQAEWSEEALSDLLVTSASVLLSMLPPCGDCVPVAREPASVKQMPNMHGHPVFTYQCLLQRIGWQTELTALSNT